MKAIICILPKQKQKNQNQKQGNTKTALSKKLPLNSQKTTSKTIN